MKRVMLLGAHRYSLLAVDEARSLGYSVVSLDANPAAPGLAAADVGECVDIVDAKACLDAARRHNVDGVLALNDFGVPTAAAVAAELGLPGLPPDAAARAVSKLAMRRTWEREGVPSCRYRAVNTLDELHEAARELDSWPLVVKPADSRGGGSRGVSRVNDASELERAFGFVREFFPRSEVLLEECLVGTEHSMELVIWQGRARVLAVSDKVKVSGTHPVDKSVIYPTRRSAAMRRRMEQTAMDAALALGLDNCASHVELCVTDSGPRLFELGARPGGGGTPSPIIPFVTGISMLGAVLGMAVGDGPGDLTPRHERGCVYHFLTPPPGTLRGVSGLDEARAMPGVLDCDVFLRPGEAVRPLRTGLDRPGFIIAGQETADEALATALAAERVIAFDID